MANDPDPKERWKNMFLRTVAAVIGGIVVWVFSAVLFELIAGLVASGASTPGRYLYYNLAGFLGTSTVGLSAALLLIASLRKIPLDERYARSNAALRNHRAVAPDCRSRRGYPCATFLSSSNVDRVVYPYALLAAAAAIWFFWLYWPWQPPAKREYTLTEWRRMK